MTGWAPHPSQQQAAKRGSATVSFEELSEAMAQQEQRPDPAGMPSAVLEREGS